LEKNSKTLEFQFQDLGEKLQDLGDKTSIQNLGEKTPSNRELEKKKLQELGV